MRAIFYTHECRVVIVRTISSRTITVDIIVIVVIVAVVAVSILIVILVHPSTSLQATDPVIAHDS